jgi:serine/threonine protein kinase
MAARGSEQMSVVKSSTVRASGEQIKPQTYLGGGSFADTYLALVLDEELVSEYKTDTVAVKIPRTRQKAQVLKHEVEVNIILRHRLKTLKNLVNYLDIIVYDGKMVMVMEYVAGGTLRSRLGPPSRQKRLAIGEAVDITEGILTGLAAIHSERIFHRDIKPENILMDEQTPKVSDLGLARILDPGTQAYTRFGTDCYVSPEILKNKGATLLSDIWSLGVTLYEMLTGKLPFGGPETPVGTLYDNIREVEPTPAREIRPEIPATLNDIIERSLRKDPSCRYQSAEEMIAALKELRNGSDNEVEKEISALRAASGILPQALEQRLRVLVQHNPQSALACLELGEFFNRCQRYSEAVATFRRGIEANPGHPLLHWDLALAVQSLGKRAVAADEVAKAIDLGLEPGLRSYAQTLLKVLQGGGRN